MESNEQLIAALRDELQQYGEMLVLLEQQQARIVRRAATEILASVDEINAQSAIIKKARQQRRVCLRNMAEQLRVPRESTLGDLSKSLMPKYQPLVQALLEENNRLLLKVRRRARQNHLLLRHSMELMHRFIVSLIPGAPTTV